MCGCVGNGKKSMAKNLWQNYSPILTALLNLLLLGLHVWGEFGWEISSIMGAACGH